jgi:hypothetical protein
LDPTPPAWSRSRRDGATRTQGRAAQGAPDRSSGRWCAGFRGPARAAARAAAHSAARDRVAADVRLLSATLLRLDVSLLTAESLPVERDARPCPPGRAVAETPCLAPAGATVATGFARGLAFATEARERVMAAEEDALVALEDPPRPGVREALATCRRAGVTVTVVTGSRAHRARDRGGGRPVERSGARRPRGWPGRARRDRPLAALLASRAPLVFARTTPSRSCGWSGRTSGSAAWWR